MNQIIQKTRLNPTVTRMEIFSPLIAKKAEPGQFIILRVDEYGERIPLTIADYHREKGTVTIIYQVVGATTIALDQLEEGDEIRDFVGPLGKPTDLGDVEKVIVIGGGVGSAIALPVAKKLSSKQVEVHSILGFRNQSLVILEEEFRACSARFCLMSDDGSCGEKGRVTDALEKVLQEDSHFDAIFVVGPLVMMKAVSVLTKKYGIKTIVSMNPIMMDGTGMCGCCRLTVGRKVKFACVDGPDFNGHEVDFDEAILRSSSYKEVEQKKREEACHLLEKGKRV